MHADWSESRPDAKLTPMRFVFYPLYAGGFAVLWLIGLATLGFNIWMLVDAIRRPDSQFNPPASRLWWIIGLAVGLALSFVGFALSIVYFFAVRKPIVEGRTPPALFNPGSAGTGAAAGRSGRTCTNCGQELGTHARFCQHCGTPVGED
jgi:hypothetical protein